MIIRLFLLLEKCCKGTSGHIFQIIQVVGSRQDFLLMFTNPFLGMLAGFVLTTLLQSSSASVGIMQAMAVAGNVTYGFAIPMILGQNIGSCTTAMLASLSFNRDAKRVSIINLIFNIINADDFVPCMPMDLWGYTRYGVSTGSLSVADSYETNWENFTGIWDYNPPGSGMAGNVDTIAGIIAAGADPRVDTYKYTCSCHGDGSNDTITITNTGMSESSRENAIAKIPANALAACIITRYEGGWLGGWDFDVCQSPAYFMQLLAAFMGGEIDAYRFAVELNIADRYESAKSALVSLGINGVEHPHYPETYVMLSQYVTANDFA